MKSYKSTTYVTLSKASNFSSILQECIWLAKMKWNSYTIAFDEGALAIDQQLARQCAEYPCFTKASSRYGPQRADKTCKSHTCMNHPKRIYHIECVKTGGPEPKDWLPYQNYTQLKGFFVECPTNCWDESHHQKRTSTRARRIAKLLLQGCSSGKTPILLAPKILTVDHLEFFLHGCRVSYRTRKVVSHDTCNYLKSPCDSARFESSPMSSWLATLVL